MFRSGELAVWHISLMFQPLFTGLAICEVGEELRVVNQRTGRSVVLIMVMATLRLIRLCLGQLCQTVLLGRTMFNQQSALDQIPPAVVSGITPWTSNSSSKHDLVDVAFVFHTSVCGGYYCHVKPLLVDVNHVEKMVEQSAQGVQKRCTIIDPCLDVFRC